MRGIVDDGQDQANGPTGAEPRTAAAFPSDPAALESTALRRCSRQIVPRHAAAGPAAAGKVQVPRASVAVERGQPWTVSRPWDKIGPKGFKKDQWARWPWGEAKVRCCKNAPL